jgi:hypothetical protein
MMGNKVFWQVAAAGVALLGLAGCAPPLPVLPDKITPDLVGAATPGDRYYQAICVKPGSEYNDTMDGYSIDIVPATMTIALSHTLYNNDLQAPENGCRFFLTASVTHIGHYLFTLPFAPIHAFATVDYTVARASDNTTVLNKSVSDDYAQDFEFMIPAYIGAQHTLFDAVNGSIQDNIKIFVEDLDLPPGA